MTVSLRTYCTYIVEDRNHGGINGEWEGYMVKDHSTEGYMAEDHAIEPGYSI